MWGFWNRRWEWSQSRPLSATLIFLKLSDGPEISTGEFGTNVAQILTCKVCASVTHIGEKRRKLVLIEPTMVCVTGKVVTSRDLISFSHELCGMDDFLILKISKLKHREEGSFPQTS